MTDFNLRVSTMQDMFMYAQNLFSWCLDDKFHLMFSNSANPDFFYTLFSVDFCFHTVKQHFTESLEPAILNDKSGIAWVATAQIENEKIQSYHLLGPFFSVEASETYLYQLCSKMKISSELLLDFIRHLKQVPTIPLNTAYRYGIMLHYCVTGKQCLVTDVSIYSEESEKDINDSWTNVNWHGTWEMEQKLFQHIKDGNPINLPEFLTQFSTGRVGTLCLDNPLRQVKNEMIVFTTLCCRAAILGGVSPEGAYNLSDYYLQRIEACNHISDVQNYGMEMCNAFIHRSMQAKCYNQYSAPIAASIEYIETHIFEKISLEAMADEIGYACYYLSNKFQKETGTSINKYIQKCKVETAKNMLRTAKFSIADISERLAFSSPSYFISTFRKYTGIAPGEFINHPKE